MRRHLFLTHSDLKARMWAKALPSKLGECSLVAGSPLFWPFWIITIPFRKGRRTRPVFVYRYMHDYPSPVMSLLRCITDAVSLGLCYVLNIERALIWHNIDEESNESWPLLVEVRRKLFLRCVQRIFVLEECLVGKARQELARRGVESTPIGVTCFGPPSGRNGKSDPDDTVLRIRKFFGQNGQGDHPIRLLVMGACGKKCTHFMYLPEVVRILRQSMMDYRILIVGPLDSWFGEESPLVRMFRADNNIMYIGKRVEIDERDIADCVDFSFKVYEDYSVPYSTYTCASAGIPIITLHKGGLGMLVREQGIGAVVETIDEIGAALRVNSGNYCAGLRRFLSDRTWERGAIALIRPHGNSDSKTRAVGKYLQLTGSILV